MPDPMPARHGAGQGARTLAASAVCLVLVVAAACGCLPDSFGTLPELPMPLLVELAEVVRRGRKVGMTGRDPQAYALVRDALVLLLDDSGGRG